MKSLLISTLVGIVVLASWTMSGLAGKKKQYSFPAHPHQEAYKNVGEKIRQTLESVAVPPASRNESSAEIAPKEGEERIKSLLSELAAALPEGGFYRLRVEAFQRKLAADLSAAEMAGVWRELRTELQGMAEGLAFRPVAEADLPEGFPAPTPVGEVELKEYPAYRAAVTRYDSSAFWRLFAHITYHGVEMTAPVEMRMNGSSPGQRAESMAFLYASPSLGRPREGGAVEVRDFPPMLVASTGVQGEMTKEAIDSARARLAAWLQAHAGRYEVDGPPRLMGYNSPFIPSEKKYFELQVPVRPSKTAKPNSGAESL